MPAHRIPTALKMLHGTYRKDRDGDPNAEPKPEPAFLPCPEWLQGLGRELWEQLGPVLYYQGCLTLADSPTFEVLCRTYQTWREHEARVIAEGAIIRSAAGSAIAHPSLKIAREAAAQFAKLASAFGMTPEARTRIKVTLDMPPSAKGRFFQAGIMTRDRAGRDELDELLESDRPNDLGQFINDYQRQAQQDQADEEFLSGPA